MHALRISDDQRRGRLGQGHLLARGRQADVVGLAGMVTLHATDPASGRPRVGGLEALPSVALSCAPWRDAMPLDIAGSALRCWPPAPRSFCRCESITLLTTHNSLLQSVNMPGRPRHPKKEVEETLEFAEARGWLVESPRPGHPWGKATCGREGHDCLVWIWSTPKNAANHAKQIQRAVNRCDAKEDEGDDRP